MNSRIVDVESRVVMRHRKLGLNTKDSNESVTRLNLYNCGEGTGTAWVKQAPCTERVCFSHRQKSPKREKKNGYLGDKENTESIRFGTRLENYKNYN